MKNRISAALVLAASFLVSFFGFTPAAQAGMDNSAIGGSSNFGGFNWSYGAYEQGGQTEAHLAVTSSTHTFTGAYSQFYTQWNNPSEGVMYMYVSGFLNSDVNQNSSSLSSNVTIGGVRLWQMSQINYWGPDEYSSATNMAYAALGVDPINLQFGWLNYNEFLDEETGRTRFYFDLNVYCSFGDGPEGDGRGMAFRAVPTPGAISLAGLGGLALLRRARRR